MDTRDLDTHRSLTRLHAKFEQLDLLQAEQKAALDRARLSREGRWQHTDSAGSAARSR